MAEGADYYPSAPADVPPDLSTPTAGYRVRVIAVLTSLVVFALLYLGLVVGSAYLCYWGIASVASGPNQASRDLFQSVFKEDERLTRRFNDALRQAREGRIDSRGFLQTLENDVLPPWRAQIQRLEQAQGLSADEQRLARQYGDSLKAQEEGWELFCRAMRQGNDLLAQEAQKKSQQADELAKQFSAAASQFYSRRGPDKKDSAFWPVVTAILAGVLCLFLVKGFFKRRRVDAARRVEVTEQDQPVLFAFIRRLCRDTRAPLPRRVYLTPDVNAAVFYHESLLDLVLPAHKNLVIGLGLVNRLNLSEFKAVLAHEFGHFSQNSMKLGGYVYASNRIIADVVFGRDWLDEAVAGLRGTDIRIAVFAWAFTGVLWTLRKTLQGLFRVINFANVALSRQMEYNADLVAVSVTGSDALIHALARLDLATEALSQAWSDLVTAADHQLYTRDLFYHQTRAAEYLRGVRQDSGLGEPPALPEDPRQAVQVFQPEDTGAPRMWATHPSNYDREQNAKRRYVRSPMDDRSPWLLFQDAPALRETVTRQLYEVLRPDGSVKLEDPEIVQSFIDTEHAETTYHPRYHGLYDQRYLMLNDLDELIRAAPPELADAARLAEARAGLYGDELRERMQAHRARRQEYDLLARLKGGAVELRGKDFSFRGARYRASEALRLLEQVTKEIEQDFAWMGELDQKAFRVHYELARQVGEAARQELDERYRFHLALQAILGELSTSDTQVRAALALIAGKPELTAAEFHGTVAALRLAHDALAQQLAAAGGLRLPALKNVTPGEPLGPFLMSGPLVPRLSDRPSGFDGEWIGRFLGQLGEVLDKARRLHFKSLGGILALQEKLAEQWSGPGRCPSPAAGVEVEPASIAADGAGGTAF